MARWSFVIMTVPDKNWADFVYATHSGSLLSTGLVRSVQMLYCPHSLCTRHTGFVFWVWGLYPTHRGCGPGTTVVRCPSNLCVTIPEIGQAMKGKSREIVTDPQN